MANTRKDFIKATERLARRHPLPRRLVEREGYDDERIGTKEEARQAMREVFTFLAPEIRKVLSELDPKGHYGEYAGSINAPLNDVLDDAVYYNLPEYHTYERVYGLLNEALALFSSY